MVDLNPFGEVTDSLLFSWEELTSGGEITQQQVSRHDTRSVRKHIPSVKTEKSNCGFSVRVGTPGVSLHHKRGDGAAQSLPELQNPT